MRRSEAPSSAMENREAALEPFGVSRETRERLQILVDELNRWQKAKNLVGPSTLAEIWSRHIADSLQLVGFAPDARRWLDLGSGAGFPGVPIALALSNDGPAFVHCVESNAKKCAFIRHVSRLTSAPVEAINARIEQIVTSFVGRVDVVTARALAPLPQLLEWTHPLLTSGAVGLFPKGEQTEAELTAARECWTFEVDEFKSATDPRGRILRIAKLAPA